MLPRPSFHIASFRFAEKFSEAAVDQKRMQFRNAGKLFTFYLNKEPKIRDLSSVLTSQFFSLMINC